MKNYIYILVLFLSISFNINAQNNYSYYYKDKLITLDLNYQHITVVTNTNFDFNLFNNKGFKPFSIKAESVKKNNEYKKYSILEFDTTQVNSTLYNQKIDELKNLQGVLNVFPTFNNDNNIIISSSYINLKLKNISDIPILNQVITTLNLEIIEQNTYNELWFLIALKENTTNNALEVATILHDLDLFKYCEPDLYFKENNIEINTETNFNYSNTNTPPNDEFYGNQWGLKNTGQHNGIVGVDINVEEAWEITEGNEGIIVSVIDEGVELIHPDLLNNVHPFSFDVSNNSAPSILRGRHGTSCAGIISAKRNNNIGVAGISENSKIMSISTQWGQPFHTNIHNGFIISANNNVSIINCSWDTIHSSTVDEAINYAIEFGRNGKGSIVVFASGNYNHSYVGTYAQIKKVLAVGALNPCGQRISPESSGCGNWNNGGSQYGINLDLMSPGIYIPTTDISDVDQNGNEGYTDTAYYQNFNGTSAAAPHVAGVASLVLSINDCLSGQQVRDILESTAQKVGGYNYQQTENRPNGIWNIEMGYGLVDAGASVQLAQAMHSPTLDLQVRNSTIDFGIEPDGVSGRTNRHPEIVLWNSPDIWVRNRNDGFTNLEHQNPEYDPNNPNYVYVKVTNKSCVNSTGTEKLKLYWASASTGMAWPYKWDGNTTTDGVLMGSPITEIDIPILQSGEEVILSTEWLVPNPVDFEIINSSYNANFSLLARIEAVDDPMFYPESSNLWINVKNNNNIAWKNITVIDALKSNFSTTLLIENTTDTTNTYNLEFSDNFNEIGKKVYKEAEVSIELLDTLYDAWQSNGKATTNTTILNENTVIINNESASINNIQLNPNEFGFVKINVNFLTKELTNKNAYNFHIIQRDINTNNVVGGHTLIIKKENTNTFIANAGNDKEIDKSTETTLNATEINEPAIYKWYDSNGNLIYTGKDLTVSPQITKTYKLEITKEATGFKDYDEVEVRIKPYRIENLSPNPTNNNVIIDYLTNGASSAYVMITDYNNSFSNNYILNTNQNNISIDVSNYQAGIYYVNLVCDGQNYNTKTLIIN